MKNGFPQARTEGLLTESIDDELVIFDRESGQAHALKPVAAAVFAAADGKASPADLAAIVSARLGQSVDVPQIEKALTELENLALLVDDTPDGISRRRFMQRGAAVGGVAVAGALITSAAVPAYGMAASLPSSTPSGFSSLAVLIEGPDGTYYGAHWANGLPGSISSWGATQANANCHLPLPMGVTVSKDSINGVSATLAAGSVLITLPAGYRVVSYAAFFGKGASCNLQCYTGSATTTPSGTYVVSFDPSCYS